jgi:hypothetical protein
MPSTFEIIVLLCGLTGVIMVVGSMMLLYHGVIKLREKVSGSEIEAEFRDQLKINVRNPALALFLIGFLFFGLALYFVQPREIAPIKLTGHIEGVDADSITIRVKVAEFPVRVSSNGEIADTLRASLHEKLSVEILAPGYKPARWTNIVSPEDALRGRIVIDPPDFIQVLEKPQPNPSRIRNPGSDVELPGLSAPPSF